MKHFPKFASALLLMTVAACSAREKSTQPRVALITPGSVADAAWNAGAYQGLERIRDSLHLQVSHVEAHTPAEQEEAIRSYAAQGYALIFAHGYEFQQPAERVAAEFPKTVIAVTSGQRAVGNVVPLIFRLREASYLAGIVAGGLTKSKLLGFVGGVELPPVKEAYEGFLAGARTVHPEIQARVTYLNNWDDAAMGHEAALALIRAGADVFHHNADAAALGLFRAAKESPGVLVFGANSDQSALLPAQVPGSAVIDLPLALYLIAQQVQAGTFTPKVEEFGLGSGVVKYVPNPAMLASLPAGLMDRVRAATDSIAKATAR